MCLPNKDRILCEKFKRGETFFCQKPDVLIRLKTYPNKSACFEFGVLDVDAFDLPRIVDLGDTIEADKEFVEEVGGACPSGHVEIVGSGRRDISLIVQIGSGAFPYGHAWFQ